MQCSVSVVIPMYNREKYVVEAIDSVLNQTFQDFEIIVLDDFSSDASCSVVQAIGDPRITLFRAKEKSGISRLRNIGNDMAEGKYISVFDSDDIMPPYRLKEQYEYMQANPDVGVVGGWCELFGDFEGFMKGPLDSDTINCGHLYRTLLFHGTAMIRKSVLTQHGIQYNEDHFVGEDWALWVDMINKVKMVNLDRVFLRYRRHGQGISSTSQSETGIRLKRRATLDRIHETALGNLGMTLDAPDMALFNRFFGETDKELAPMSQAQYEEVKRIIESLKRQALQLPIHAEAFSTYTDEWAGKMAKRHGLID